MADAMRLLTMLADLDDEKREIKYVISSQTCVYAMTTEQFTRMLRVQTDRTPSKVEPSDFGGIFIGHLALDAQCSIERQDAMRLLGQLYVRKLDAEADEKYRQEKSNG